MRDATGLVRRWASILKLVEEAGFSVHAYAHDLQVYGHASPKGSVELMAKMSLCVECQQPALYEPCKDGAHLARVSAP